MAGMRFTSWLSEDERAALRKLAAECECSENLIVRIALRGLLFDKPIPSWVAHEVRAQLETQVTGVTRA